MKTLSQAKRMVTNNAFMPQTAFKVCMHVHSGARTDGRVMRSATALVEAGYSVSIVDIERDMIRPDEEVVQGVTLKHLKLTYRVPAFTFPFLLAAVKLLLFGVLQLVRVPADVYHAHDVNALPATFLAAFLRRKPVLFDAHEHPTGEGLSSQFKHRLHRVLKVLLRLLLPRCAGVITVSPLIAQGLCDQYSLPEVTLIRNFPTYQAVQKTNRLREVLGLNPETRIALYQGALQANRDLDRLICAAPFLEQNNVIVFMGQDMHNTRARLESLILHEGVADRVKILPAAPYEDLLAWTSSADLGLVVLPLDYSLSIRWCLPNKLFEYLMAGLPVLSSTLDAVTDIIHTYDVGEVVSSLTPQDIANAINHMLSDQVACRRMRTNALIAARQDLCWDKEKHVLIHLYHRILGMSEVKSRPLAKREKNELPRL